MKCARFCSRTLYGSFCPFCTRIYTIYMSKKVAKKLEIMMSCTRLYVGSTERWWTKEGKKKKEKRGPDPRIDGHISWPYGRILKIPTWSPSSACCLGGPEEKWHFKTKTQNFCLQRLKNLSLGPRYGAFFAGLRFWDLTNIGHDNGKRGRGVGLPPKMSTLFKGRIQWKFWFCYQKWPNYMIWPGYGRSKVTGQNGQKGSTIP